MNLRKNILKGQQAVRTGRSRMLMLLTFALLSASLLHAQQATKITLTGTVTDESGEPLPGVNVVVKGTTNGTVTNLDGEYSFIVAPTDLLIYRFIGFKEQEIAVNNRKNINVVLYTDVTDLDEVVIVGYGEVKRENLLGSVSSMSSKEIEDIPVTNLTNLLEGRLAGVSVSPAQPTGNPGATTRIKIRAETTFGEAGGGAKDPSPLYIVDGFEVTQAEYDVLDPSEIESFSILKDASAAVYGSKGANGVILVKTKRGREGKLRISYSGSVGISDATTQTEMLSSYDHARMLNAIKVNDPEWNVISDAELNELKNHNYNWLDEAWKTAAVTRHTINVSGGSEKVQYFAGGSFVYNGGNFDDMGVGKHSYRMGFDANVVKGLQAAVTISLDSRDFTRPYIGATGTNTMQGIFEQLLQAPRWTVPYIDGKAVNIDGYNPFAIFNTESYKKNVDKGNTLNLRLSYEFEKIKGLSASASFSRRENHYYSKEYRIPYELYNFLPKGDYRLLLSNQLDENIAGGPVATITNSDRINESYSYGQRYQLNVNLNYNRTFGKHKVASFLTYEQAESSGYAFGATAEQMLIYGIHTQNAFNSKGAATTDGTMSESGDLGMVARLNYSYDDKYLLESTVRYENTVKFAPGYRSAVFPAASVGWIASNENFMKDHLAFINFLKIRYSTGLTGYNSVGNYEYLLSYGPSTIAYLFGGSPVGGMGIAGKTDVVSTGVTWEKSFMNNLGFDFKFLEQRLSVSLDAYYTYQYDILDKQTTIFPVTSGIDEMPSENIGRLEAWGYDMELGYNGEINNDFRWNIKGVFSFGSNRILDRPTDKQPNDFRYPIGQSTFAAGREEGYISNGIIRTQEQLDAINAEWIEKWGHPYTIGGETDLLGAIFLQDIGRPGDLSAGEPPVVFEPDGKIDVENTISSDKTYVERVNDHFVLKNLLPSNISMGATYKGVKFSMLWGMSYGITNKVVDKLARTVPTVSENAPAFWADYWTPDNTDAAYPNPRFAEYNQLVSTFWMRDVFQLRLRNVNVSYNIPADLSRKWGIPDLRIFFVGTNLWTPISTFDYKEDAIARFNTYPLLRTFSFGVNLKI